MLKTLQKRIAVASKREAADLVFRNGRIVNVFTSELMTGDVAIVDGVIAGIGSYDGKEVVDVTGKYIVPGFIDGHVHIESAMVTPAEFARIVLPHGVTAIVADPHEIANVAGTKGIQYMLNASEELPFDVFFMIPSCVPATPFENAGARLEASEIAKLLPHDRVLGLGEVMDYYSVASGEPGMLEKLSLGSANMDGHAAGIEREALNVYMAAGIRTDHECVNAEEAKDRLDLGMYLMIREGSVAKDLEALLPAVTPANSRRCVFVTDDKHLDDLMDEGSVDFNVRKAIEKGIPPITAIQMATINTAECFGLKHIGAVAPGYQADLLIVDDLEHIAINQVYKKGQLVAASGTIQTVCQPSAKPADVLIDSVHIPYMTADQLAISLSSNEKCHVIEIIPNSLVTNHLIEPVESNNGFFTPSTTRDQLKLAVIERHKRTGNIGLGIVKGFKLKSGAISSTVAHDSHNLIVVGQNDEDMLTAIRHTQQIRGGICVVTNGKVLASLSLPIAGLLSDRDHLTLYKELHKLNLAVKELGASSEFNPFITLSFLALPVIPQLKLTDVGLFDFNTFSHIPIPYMRGEKDGSR